MTDNNENSKDSLQEVLSNSKVYPEDQFVGELESLDEEDEGLENKVQSKIEKIKVKIGTLLKSDTFSFLFGAGVSKDYGGVLLGKVPKKIEREILEKATSRGTDINEFHWIKPFYLAGMIEGADLPNELSADNDEWNLNRRISKLRDNTGNILFANYEAILSRLYNWKKSLEGSQQRQIKISVSENQQVSLKLDQVENALEIAKETLVEFCELPSSSESSLKDFRSLIRKILTRPLNLRRPKIFTLNYDTLVEQAAEKEGVVLLDGFVGNIERVFRPESYNQDLYFPADTTEGNVHRHDSVLHLYKLHGSINWVPAEPKTENPYGVTSKHIETIDNKGKALIYPSPSKYQDYLGMPYSEMFRQFANTIVRSQSTLIVMGYGFGDDHVNAIIRQALSQPSFKLVIVDPKPNSDFVNKLKELEDSRVWIFEKRLGRFSNFIEYALPDLREHEIERKVIKTYRALHPEEFESGGDASE